jgi:peptide/nickel transport system substrate-binding protein
MTRRSQGSAPELTRRELLVLGGAAALTGPQARAAGNDTVRVAFPVPIGTLDPARFRTGGMEFNYAYAVFNRLTTNDTKLRVQPDLATSWESSPDLRIWTFYLRPGVKFHNGMPFDAGDVVFSYGRMQDPAFGSIMRARLDIVAKIEAVDPMTVRFTLKIAYADMPALVGCYESFIMTESAIDTLTTHPIGTGPFRFVDYLPGDHMTLERNPDYFVAGGPTVAGAVFQVIPEYTIAVAALESGEMDIVFDLPPEQIDKLQRSSVAGVAEIESGFWQGFVMHCGMKPFDDPRVREAFIKIIDKPSFADIATFGHATPTVSPIPPGTPFYRADIPLGADIQGAKKLLAEAGFGGGMTVEMYVPGNSPQMERLATAFRDAAKEANVTVMLHVVPQDKFFAEMEGKVAFNVDQFLGQATPDLTLYDSFHSTGDWNNTLWHYKNDEVDRLLDAARATTDMAEQARLYGRFQEIIVKDGPGSAVYVQSFACGVSRRVRNLEVSPMQRADISRVTLTDS